jgi:nitronate monooxygenase
VIAAPLFIISNPELTIAQYKAGVIGSFPALNARPPALLDEWLARIRETLDTHDARHPGRPAALTSARPSSPRKKPTRMPATNK